MAVVRLNPVYMVPLSFTVNSSQATLTRFGGWAYPDGSHGSFGGEVATISTTTNSIGTISLYPSSERPVLVFDYAHATGTNIYWQYGWLRSNGTIAFSLSTISSRVMFCASW